MRYRNPFVVFALCVSTVGVYVVIWSFKTSREMTRLKQKVSLPKWRQMFVPSLDFIWMRQYLKAAERVTAGQVNFRRYFAVYVNIALIGYVLLAASIGVLLHSVLLRIQYGVIGEALTQATLEGLVVFVFAIIIACLIACGILVGRLQSAFNKSDQ